MAYNHLRVRRGSDGRFTPIRSQQMYSWVDNPYHPHWDDQLGVVMSHIFSRATISEWENASERVIDTPIPEDRYWCAVRIYEDFFNEKWEKNGICFREFVHV